MTQQLMTVKEVAAELRLSKMTVYRLCSSGLLPNTRIGRSFRISRSDFETFIENRKTG